jgi:hypothetical protein
VQEGLGAHARVLQEAPELTLAQHFDYLDGALSEARAAPLSQRRVMLVVMLADAFVERLFDAGAAGGDDILAYREKLTAQHASLALVHAIARQEAGGPRLVTEAVTVPPDDYPKLGIADFMVSIYNQHSVQRVLVALRDGSRRDAHELVDEAVGALSANLPPGAPSA